MARDRVQDLQMALEREDLTAISDECVALAGAVCDDEKEIDVAVAAGDRGFWANVWVLL